jgi:putative flippase GtrA
LRRRRFLEDMRPTALEAAERLAAPFRHPSFGRFIGVGASGFAIDAAVLFVLIRGASFGPLPARLASFSVAVFCTWLMNRLWTFAAQRSRRRLPEFVRYVTIQLSGGALNFTLYAIVVLLFSDAVWGPGFGIVIGSAAGLLFNYLGARFIAFRGASCPTGIQNP